MLLKVYTVVYILGSVCYDLFVTVFEQLFAPLCVNVAFCVAPVLKKPKVPNLQKWVRASCI